MGGSFARTLLPDPVPSATYDSANRQLQFGSKTMEFDANGNLRIVMEGGQTTNYVWDERDRLVGLDSLPGTFDYDGFGRRARKSTGGEITSFSYDGDDIVLELTGGIEVRYLHGPSFDEPVAGTAATGTSYYLADSLGSILALTDSSGAGTTHYTYSPFGQTAVGGSQTGNSFQYTARENDATGLYFYRARYFAPSLHRFISEDPIAFDDGEVNLYLYVANNPLVFTDPFGLAKDECTFGKRYARSVRLTRETTILGPIRAIGAVRFGAGAVAAAGLNRLYDVPGILSYGFSAIRTMSIPRIAGNARIFQALPGLVPYFAGAGVAGATLTAKGSIVLVGATAAVKGVAVYVTFEGAIRVGSAINAGFVTPVITRPLFGITGCE